MAAASLRFPVAIGLCVRCYEPLILIFRKEFIGSIHCKMLPARLILLVSY